MHKIKTLGLLTILLTASFVLIMDNASISAQDTALAEQYTSPDGQLTVSYPQGWFASADGEDGTGILLANVALGEEGVTPFDVSSEEIVITIARPADLAGTGLIVPASENPVFMAGHFSGLFSTLLSFFADGQSVSVSNVALTEINGSPAASVDLQAGAGLMRILLVTKGDELLYVNSILQQAQLARWEPLMMSIVESVEMSGAVANGPEVVAEPVPVIPTDTCNNVALEITSYSDSFNYPNNDDRLLLDGDPNTGWLSTAGDDGSWLFVTLDGLHIISSVHMNSYATSGTPENSIREFDIVHYNVDTGEFDDIFLGTAPMQAGNQIYEFDPVNVADIAIFVVSNHGGPNVEIADIMVCTQ